MKKIVLILCLTVTSFAAQARSIYTSSKDRSGSQCEVMVDLDLNTIRFSYPYYAYTFRVDADEIRLSILESKNPVVIEGGDALLRLKLFLTFDHEGHVLKATYRQRALVVPTTIECHDFVRFFER